MHTTLHPLFALIYIEKYMKSIFTYIALIAMTLISGCTILDGNAIVTGNIRSALSSNDVQLYRVVPASFEEIAIVSASAGHDFKKDSVLMNEAILRLKEEAAKVGANGVVLTQINERDVPNFTTTLVSVNAIESDSNTAYTLGNVTTMNRGDTYTRIKGIAIYVNK